MKTLKIAALMTLAFVMGLCGLGTVLNCTTWLDSEEDE